MEKFVVVNGRGLVIDEFKANNMVEAIIRTNGKFNKLYKVDDNGRTIEVIAKFKGDWYLTKIKKEGF